MAFEKAKLAGGAAALGLIGGLLIPQFVEGTPSNNYSHALEDQMDASAAGGKYAADTFGADRLPAGDAASVGFAVNTMLRFAGEDPADKPDPKVKAAAACVLVVANGMPLGKAATAAWGDGRNNDRSEVDGAEKVADQRYLDAAGACVSILVERATRPDAFAMTVPVTAAA
jgi:hypothetical protein